MSMSNKTETETETQKRKLNQTKNKPNAKQNARLLCRNVGGGRGVTC